MRDVFLPALAGAALLALAGQASAAAYANGSFELPGGDVREQITAGTVPGWTYVSGPAGFEIYESDDTGDGLTAADGTHYISFGHDGAYGGSIYQDFDTTIGTDYTVTYSVAEQQGDDPTQNMRAIITNGSQILSQDNTALTLSFLAGAPITFTATTDLTRLTFFDATPAGDGGGSNLALDAVAINGSYGSTGGGVPEPATWALMLLGVAGVGAVARRGGREVASIA